MSTKGEKMTFLDLFTKKKFRIEMPMIQRDYAQGRTSEKEIREVFLNALENSLRSGKNLDLDFIYGSEQLRNGTIFIPLDGQQRLTTLFLLHWYLAHKDERHEDFKRIISSDNRSHFSYKTRTSSKEFCDELVTKDVNIYGETISGEIKNSNWFYLSWERDPTIASMLVMLDDIQQVFKDSANYYSKLSDPDNPIITFQYLNLEDFTLTDDLYIKMNSRGKLLTSFENFKANLTGYISNIKLENPKTTAINKVVLGKGSEGRKYFSRKIDGAWANLFWSYAIETKKGEKIYDNQMMFLIQTIAANHYAGIKNEKINSNALNSMVGEDGKDAKTPFVTYYKLKKYGCLDEDIISDIIDTFDLLTDEDFSLKTVLQENDYYHENEMFEKIINNKQVFKIHKLRFYAYYKFLIENRGESLGLLEWMRVVYNLTENTTYNTNDDFIRSIISIKALLNASKNINNYLSVNTNKVGGFLEHQIAEERIKSCLILKDDSWKQRVLSAEKHKYFNGQINFILNFSGIEDYYNSEGNCDWSTAENANFHNTFDSSFKMASAIFDENGVPDELQSFWRRALLTKGNYLLSIGNSRNASFLINKHRDISWNRLLRDDNKGKRRFVKELFDDDLFDYNAPLKSLNAIIEHSVARDWRLNFIKYPGMLGYLGPNMFIQEYNDFQQIYLLTKERRSADHAEAKTYAFFQKEEKSPFLPFSRVWYWPSNGDINIPCAVIGDWNYKSVDYAIDIRFMHDNHKYEIRVFARKGGEMADDIIDILSFETSASYNDLSQVRLVSEEELLAEINGVCSKLISLEG